MSKFSKISQRKNRFSKDRLIRSAATPRKWFNIVNKEKEEEIPEVFIYDQIGQDWWGEGVSPQSFIEEVKSLDCEKFNLHINSPGGFVHDGLAIYHWLNRSHYEIDAYIDGLAASMASVIPMVADRIYMPKNAEFMIHDPWTMMVGSANDFRKEADELDSIKESILGIYVARTGADRDELAQLMEDETYIKGERALELGFADELEEPKKLAACEYDLLFTQDLNKRNAATQKRNLESQLREAGWSKTESIAIANRSESVVIGPEDSTPTETKTIILR